jgi:hypothetical protein
VFADQLPQHGRIFPRADCNKVGRSIVGHGSRATPDCRSDRRSSVSIHEKNDISGDFETLPGMLCDFKDGIGIIPVSLMGDHNGSEWKKPMLCAGRTIHTRNARRRPYDYGVAIDNRALPAGTVIKLTADGP